MATPNLGITLPTVGGSTDTWGATLNTGITAIDTVFGSSGTNVSMADVSVDQLTVIAQGDLRLADTTGGQYIAFQAAGTTTSYTLTMPAGVPSADDVLTASDGSGTLSWAAPTTGDLTAIVAGAGLTGTSLSGPVPTLNVIGTADKITVSADAVTIASTYVGQTSITTLGTIATGTWEGSTVAVNQGGTGATTFTDGGVLLGSGTGAITATAVLGDGEILIGDASGDPATLDVGSSTAITILGTVATGVWNGTAVGVAYGGTAISSYAAGDIIYASGSTTLAKLAKGSDTEVLTLASGVPTWAAPTVGDITGITAGTGLSGTNLTGPVPTLNVDAAQTQITSVGTLTSLAVGDITSTGDLVVGGVGPHTIGGSNIGYVQMHFTGAFTSSGASTTATGILGNQVITGASGDTASICGMRLASSTVTQTATESIGYISQLCVEEPAITDNLTGDITVASTVHIKNAPTEGESNYALLVDDGAVQFDGTLDVTGTITGNLTGNVTGNTSGTAATVTGAAQSAITSVGTLTSLGVGAITSTGAFVTSSSGPHAIGGSAVGRLGINITGAFTSDGSATSMEGVRFAQDLTGASGDTASLSHMAMGSDVGASITTQTATESIGLIATMNISEPGIADNLTGDITKAATLYIGNAPTEGESNYALLVDAGAVQFDGTLAVVGDATITADLILGTNNTSKLIGINTLGAEADLVYLDNGNNVSIAGQGNHVAMGGTLAVTSSSQFNSTLNLGGSNSLNSAANRLQFTTAGAVARGQIQHSRIATGDIQILSSDSANITLVPSGGTVIIDGALTVGAITASGLPTSDPSVANQLWNDSGTVKISAG